jgi:hypothetical protein
MRDLEAWEPEDTDADNVGGLCSGGANGWDAEEMFARNKNEFGVKSSFKPSLEGYTTQLNKDKVSTEEHRYACCERISKTVGALLFLLLFVFPETTMPVPDKWPVRSRAAPARGMPSSLRTATRRRRSPPFIAHRTLPRAGSSSNINSNTTAATRGITAATPTRVRPLSKGSSSRSRMRAGETSTCPQQRDKTAKKEAKEIEEETEEAMPEVTSITYTYL